MDRSGCEDFDSGRRIAATPDTRQRTWSRYLLLLLLASLLGAGCGEDDAPATEEAAAAKDSLALRFVAVTDSAGLGNFRHQTGASGNHWLPETLGGGGGFLDYDGDQWPDVVLVGGGVWSDSTVDAVRLYRNERNGTFRDVTEEAGLAGIEAYAFGVTSADYDNDGDADLYVATLAENLLFRNDAGRFTEVGRAAGVAGEPVWSTSAAFFDADRDGYLDLYVGNYVAWSPKDEESCRLRDSIPGYCTPDAFTGLAGRFYRNRGDGTFVDWSEEAGFVPSPGGTGGVALYDLNRDGWPEVITVGGARDLVYLNGGDGTFTKPDTSRAAADGLSASVRVGTGLDVGVLDPTGQPTYISGTASNQMIGVFRRQTDTSFADRSALSRVGRQSAASLAFGVFLFDADLDGDLDLFAANGSFQPGVAPAQPTHLLLNDGVGQFEDVAPTIAGALARPMNARGAAYADYDRDGDLDVLVTENGGPAHLFRNDVPGRKALRIVLIGTESNRDGIGARVNVYAGGRPMEQMVRTGSSYLSVSEKALTFGLGAANDADSVVVTWPSGAVDRHVEVPAGIEAVLTEGSRQMQAQVLLEPSHIVALR